jgi:hypothetical protein
MSLPMPPSLPDTAGAWSWISNLLAPGGALAVFGLLFGLTQSRITDVRDQAKQDLEKVESDLNQDVADLRALTTDGQRQYLEILKGLRELPTRTEMQHDLQIIESRLSDRINKER